ncbi:hypothetical protein AB1Y20_002580 [Prymnesium parvum]|uniref:MORN repeat-containing protein 5 n=1 Tax=Prymnesium parvum TaxID=97485 RepID=A0AB34J9H3_PRYPA
MGSGRSRPQKPPEGEPPSKAAAGAPAHAKEGGSSKQDVYTDGNGGAGPLNAAGEREGYGVITTASGDQYAGFLVAGKLEGKGRYEYASGAWYEGCFAGGLQQGAGVYHSPNGSQYVGDFAEDTIMEGLGVYSWADGALYFGNFLKGEMHGQGVNCFVNGAVYDGSYKTGKKDGVGVYHFKEGIAKLGRYVEDKFDGVGVQFNAARNEAWKLDGAENLGQISMEEALQIANSFGLGLPPPTDEVRATVKRDSEAAEAEVLRRIEEWGRSVEATVVSAAFIANVIEQSLAASSG